METGLCRVGKEEMAMLRAKPAEENGWTLLARHNPGRGMKFLIPRAG
jgi:hypothetical protein